eukprot:CAMPEP_0195287662 /NCGR_PEP_ID=MMETSP0707-20130614/4634_1 /TAXON_ID=33640 /ORGANISM="Asterionellopsis glacialis, Strain CCMP134" /LENGTH=169 /DNA_ID=CAMNT_0040347439 /DNA_START=33 /DNA_END=542 /DNA_ORIENTATION=+
MGCGGSKEATKPTVVNAIPSNADGEYNQKDYDDLLYLANKREIKVTINTSTKAGIVAGLAVMGGTLVAGPVGAAVGGAVGTAMAVSMSKNVVGLNQLLNDTPQEKRREIIMLFSEAFREEFTETINGNPELKLLMRGGTPISVVRYMVEKDIIQDENAKKLDGILTRIS